MDVPTELTCPDRRPSSDETTGATFLSSARVELGVAGRSGGERHNLRKRGSCFKPRVAPPTRTAPESRLNSCAHVLTVPPSLDPMKERGFRSW